MAPLIHIPKKYQLVDAPAFGAWFEGMVDPEEWSYWGDNFARELNLDPSTSGKSMYGNDYLQMQEVPLGHHYYGWGNNTKYGGSRRQYFDEYAWGGFNASPDLPWGQGGNRDLWIRREDTGPMDNPSVNFGAEFDGGHFLLLDLNVSDTGTQSKAGSQGQGYGLQPHEKPTGMPDEWVCGGPTEGKCADQAAHCARYPGAGLVWVEGDSGGRYKQCCFQGDVCYLEYMADKANVDIDNMLYIPGEGGWAPAKEVYDFGGKIHDTHDDLPVQNAAKDANLMQWAAFTGGAGAGGAALADGLELLPEVVGEAVPVVGKAGAHVAADEFASEFIEDGTDFIDGDVPPPAPRPTEPELPEPLVEEVPPPAYEPTAPNSAIQSTTQTGLKGLGQAWKNGLQDAVKGIAEAANAAMNLSGVPNVEPPSVLPNETIHTARSEPGVTYQGGGSSGSAAPTPASSGDSIKLEGVLIAVVGIGAGALILRHYWLK